MEIFKMPSLQQKGTTCRNRAEMKGHWTAIQCGETECSAIIINWSPEQQVLHTVVKLVFTQTVHWLLLGYQCYHS